jgi:hypothetical protein
MTYSWFFYQEPSSYHESVEIEDPSSTTAMVTFPSNASGKTIHIILEIHDDGAPHLYAYRRVIINVQ